MSTPRPNSHWKISLKIMWASKQIYRICKEENSMTTTTTTKMTIKRSRTKRNKDKTNKNSKNKNKRVQKNENSVGLKLIQSHMDIVSSCIISAWHRSGCDGRGQFFPLWHQGQWEFGISRDIPGIEQPRKPVGISRDFRES